MAVGAEVTSEQHRSFSTLIASSFRHGSALWLLGLFVILFSITAPSSFPTLLTLQIVLSDHVTTALLALAILVPMCAGAFDFSVGALLAFSMALVAVLTDKGIGVLAAAIIAILATAACGALSGLMVVRFRVNSFIATLGVSQVAAALTFFVTQNQQIVASLPPWFVSVSQQKLLGIGLDVYYLLILAGLLWFVLEHTPIGRNMFATGGNPEAARLAGVRVNGVIWASLITSGAISGFAGVLLIGKVGVFSQEYGPGFLFAAFAAVFFGATQIKSRPNVWGTLVALYVLATAVAGLQLTFFGNEYWITPLFNGAALLIAVALASRSYTGRAYRKRRRGETAADSDADSVAEQSTPIPAVVERGFEE